MFEVKTKMDIWELNHVHSHYLKHSTRYLFFIKYQLSSFKISSTRKMSLNKFILHVFEKTLIASLLYASDYTKAVRKSKSEMHPFLQKSVVAKSQTVEPLTSRRSTP